MATPLAINEALDRLAELDGMPIEIEGVLAVEPEGYHLLHYPYAERRPDYYDGRRNYHPTVALGFGNGSLQPNQNILPRWVGKRVRVLGVLHSRQISRSLDHMDFLGLLTLASIESYSVQRLVAEERREHGA